MNEPTEQERALLLSRLVTAQEDERLRLSRRLHDEFGQNLTVLLIGLGTIEHDIHSGTKNDSDTVHKVQTLKQLTQQMIDQCGDLARELRPLLLDTVGLPIALAQLVHDWGQVHGVRTDFEEVNFDANTLRSHKPVETAIYRIAQEALINVARHAEATVVSVLLKRLESEVLLIVEDNGKGFDVQAISTRGRLGLVGMRERTEACGGQLDIESGAEGTTIFARFPIED